MGTLDPNRGARLVRAMAAAGVTVARLADHCHCSPATVSNWRKGHEISASQLVKIAQLLKISLDWLLLGNGGNGISEEDLRRLWRFKQLPPRERRAVAQLVGTLSDRDDTETDGNL